MADALLTDEEDPLPRNLTTTEAGIRTDPISSALKGLATIA
jgi:hypothetical protein